MVSKMMMARCCQLNRRFQYLSALNTQYKLGNRTTPVTWLLIGYKWSGLVQRSVANSIRSIKKLLALAQPTVSRSQFSITGKV